MTIIARKDFEPNTLEELVEYVKANADTVTYANAGIGAASHLCGMLFMDAIDTQLTTVPYQGTGPAMTDLLGGQVDFMCDQTTNTTGQIQGGEVKAYAVTTPERLATLPDLPTTAEAGLPDFQVGVWHGLYAPAGTPEEALAKLTAALQTALQTRTSSRASPSSAPRPAPPRRRRPRRTPRSRRPDRALAADHRGGGRPMAAVAAAVRGGRATGEVAEGHPGRADLHRLRRSPSASPPPATRSAPRSGWGRATSRWSSPACWSLLGLAIVAKGLPAAAADEPARRRSRGAAIVLILAALVFFGATVRGLGLAPALFVTAFLSALASRRNGPLAALGHGRGADALLRADLRLRPRRAGAALRPLAAALSDGAPRQPRPRLRDRAHARSTCSTASSACCSARWSACCPASARPRRSRCCCRSPSPSSRSPRSSCSPASTTARSTAARPRRS